MKVLLVLLAMMLASGGALALQVVDDAGRTVALPAPAQRIVALSPHATELVFAAGAGDRVVGVSGASDWPPAAASLPRVGDGAGLDPEAILALRPDLVVAWQSGNSRARLEQLGQLGVAVFYSEPRRIEDIPSSLERLGVLAGTAGQARRAAERFRREVEALGRRYRDRSPVRVFYQIWDRPLMTVNGEHIISAWLRLCGARNIFSSLPALAGAVDREAVIAADPQAIVAGSYPGKPADWIQAWTQWPDLQAVRGGHLFTVPADLLERQTPRAVEGARVLCEKIDAVRRAMNAVQPVDQKL